MKFAKRCEVVVLFMLSTRNFSRWITIFMVKMVFCSWCFWCFNSLSCFLSRVTKKCRKQPRFDFYWFCLCDVESIFHTFFFYSLDAFFKVLSLFAFWSFKHLVINYFLNCSTRPLRFSCVQIFFTSSMKYHHN